MQSFDNISGSQPYAGPFSWHVQDFACNPPYKVCDHASIPEGSKAHYQCQLISRICRPRFIFTVHAAHASNSLR